MPSAHTLTDIFYHTPTHTVKKQHGCTYSIFFTTFLIIPGKFCGFWIVLNKICISYNMKVYNFLS